MSSDVAAVVTDAVTRIFRQKLPVVRGVYIATPEEAFENQTHTNEAFSEKWRAITSSKTIAKRGSSRNSNGICDCTVSRTSTSSPLSSRGKALFWRCFTIPRVRRGRSENSIVFSRRTASSILTCTARRGCRTSCALSEQLTVLGKMLSDLRITIDVPDIPALNIKGREAGSAAVHLLEFPQVLLECRTRLRELRRGQLRLVLAEQCFSLYAGRVRGNVAGGGFRRRVSA